MAPRKQHSKRPKSSSSKLKAGGKPADLAYEVPHLSDSRASAPIVDLTDPNPLGGANDDDILAVSINRFGEGPELDAPEIGIAIEAISKAIGCRIRNSASVADPESLAVFLISDQARSVSETLGAHREPIVDNGSMRLVGRLWVASPAFHAGYWLSLNAIDAAGIFKEVADHGLDSSAAVVFDPNATDLELRFYPNGVADPECVQSFLIAEQSFTLDALDRVLRRFHETSIITPDAAMREQNPWKSSSDYVPRPRAEAFFQALLKMALNIAFDYPFKIYFEVPGTEGRCDLFVVSRHLTNGSEWSHHAALELKVVRSLDAGKNSVSRAKQSDAISSGLLQAVAYRNEHSAEVGMLCCFDMRLPQHCDGDALLDPERENADHHNIELRRYRLYGSSADLRSDRYGELSGA